MSSLQSYDALISPVAPTAAWKLGEKIDDPLSMYKSDIMTVNLNLAGKPLKSKSEGDCHSKRISNHSLFSQFHFLWWQNLLWESFMSGLDGSLGVA